MHQLCEFCLNCFFFCCCCFFFFYFLVCFCFCFFFLRKKKCACTEKTYGTLKFEVAQHWFACGHFHESKKRTTVFSFFTFAVYPSVNLCIQYKRQVFDFFFFFLPNRKNCALRQLHHFMHALLNSLGKRRLTKRCDSTRLRTKHAKTCAGQTKIKHFLGNFLIITRDVAASDHVAHYRGEAFNRRCIPRQNHLKMH